MPRGKRPYENNQESTFVKRRIKKVGFKLNDTCLLHHRDARLGLISNRLCHIHRTCPHREDSFVYVRETLTNDFLVKNLSPYVMQVEVANGDAMTSNDMFV